jgi:acylphosphatase
MAAQSVKPSAVSAPSSAAKGAAATAAASTSSRSSSSASAGGRVTSASSATRKGSDSSPTVESFTFEIRGKVQGVFFRKYTHSKAVELGLSGYVENHPSGSVIGSAIGPATAMEAFRRWLTSTGSPKSRIDSADFTPVTVDAETARKCIAKRLPKFEIRKE